MSNPFPFDIGDTVICVYKGVAAYWNQIGKVDKIDNDQYDVRGDDGKLIGKNWADADSWIKIPAHTRPMTSSDIKNGVKVVCIWQDLTGIVGTIHRASPPISWYVKDAKGNDIAGGYWSNAMHFRVILEEESPKTLKSGSISIDGDIVAENISVSKPIISSSNPCPRKYSGLDTCTCGTCPPKRVNPAFLIV